MQIICYRKCGTCQKAKKYLVENHLIFDDREITEDPLSLEELIEIQRKSGLSIKRLLNTSGGVYRELDMKVKVTVLKNEEILQLLADHPMLVKRPFLIRGEDVLVGFKESEWDALLKMGE